MSYAVLHMQKFKMTDLRKMQGHNSREWKQKSNPDIDQSRTANNYDLISCADYCGAVKARISELPLTKAVRKDAVVYCSIIVTSDHDFFENLSAEQQHQFFADSVKWLSARYGADRIVNATIHMDERTPHLHLGLVPITKEGNLSAKKLFDRKELTALQTDFAREIGSKYGLERGKEGSTAKHLDVMRYKVATAKAELKALETQLENCGDRTLLELADLKASAVRQQVHATLCGISKESADEFYNEWERLERWSEARLSGALEQEDIEELY